VYIAAHQFHSPLQVSLCFGKAAVGLQTVAKDKLSVNKPPS
jgi:hypothetical protein